MSKFSEEEDDPAIYESSGSEWNSSSEYDTKRRRSSRRTAAAKKGKPKRTSPTTTESPSEEEDSEDSKPRKNNGVAKKQKVVECRSPDPGKNSDPKTINSKDFSTGSFLILKKDAQIGDKNKNPCIWRVDGKALLQKFVAFEDNGVTRHKTTSTYTGWSALDRDLYAPVSVTIKHHKEHTLIADLDWEKLKEINVDSD